MASKQRSPESATGPRWPDLPIGWRSEPFQFGPLLRVARLGLARQSSGFLRRLEQQRDVRASISRTGIRTTVPQMPAQTFVWAGTLSSYRECVLLSNTFRQLLHKHALTRKRCRKWAGNRA